MKRRPKSETEVLCASLPGVYVRTIFIKLAGSLTAGVLLSQLLYWWGKVGGNEFYKTNNELSEETGLTPNELWAAKNKLKKSGLIKVEQKGIPPKSHYTLSVDTLNIKIGDVLDSNCTKSGNSTVLSGGIQHVAFNEVKRSKTTTIDNVDTQKSSVHNTSISGKFPPDSIEYMLSKVLLDSILVRKPNYFGPIVKEKTEVYQEKIQKWSYDIDLMLRRDERDPEKVLDVLIWSQDDPFWQKNINSAAKLREKYSRLEDLLDAQNTNNQISTQFPLEDKYQKVTEEVKEMFCTKFLGKRTNNFTTADNNKFIEAAIQAVKFSKAAKLMLRNMPEYLIECMGKNYGDNGMAVTPGHLCSNRTWGILMPQYLKDLGLVMS